MLLATVVPVNVHCFAQGRHLGRGLPVSSPGRRVRDSTIPTRTSSSGWPGEARQDRIAIIRVSAHAVFLRNQVRSSHRIASEALFMRLRNSRKIFHYYATSFLKSLTGTEFPIDFRGEHLQNLMGLYCTRSLVTSGTIKEHSVEELLHSKL